MKYHIYAIYIFSVAASLGIILDATHKQGFLSVCAFIYFLIIVIYNYNSNYNEKDRLRRMISDLDDKLYRAEHDAQYFSKLSEKLEEENNALRHQLSELTKDEK